MSHASCARPAVFRLDESRAKTYGSHRLPGKGKSLPVSVRFKTFHNPVPGKSLCLPFILTVIITSKLFQPGCFFFLSFPPLIVSRL